MNRIWEVLKGFKRNFAMAIASLILIFLTMIVLGVMIIISFSTASVATDIKQSLEIHVYLNTNITKSEKDNIEKQIESDPDIASYTFSSKDQQLQEVTDDMTDGGTEIYNYFEKSNPLNDVINIETTKGADQAAITSQLKTLQGVESVDYGQDEGADQLIKSMQTVKYVSILIVVVLSVTTIFLIINTIKLTIDSRKKEIEIMRLVGATKGYIMFPFTVEGFLFGFVGGTLAFIVLVLLYQTLYNSAYLALFRQFLIAPGEIYLILLFSQVIFGIFIGVISSLVAIRNYLKV